MGLYKEVVNLKVDENLAVMTDTGMVHCTYAAGFVDALTQVAPIALKAEARIKELEDMISRLVKENDLAMSNEKYQWMYSPMRVECFKLLEGK